MTIVNYLPLCLFVISACLLADTVAHEAIVGGYQLPPRAGAQHTVSVQYPEHHHACGGNIIRSQFVLTAAHCVVDFNNEFIATQMYVRDKSPDNYPEWITIQVERIYVPREYNRRTYVGDIAVLKLRHATRQRRPHGNNNDDYLELSTNQPQNLVDQQASIAGFGWTRVWPRSQMSVIGSGDHNRLAFIPAYMLSNHECEQVYPRGMINSTIHLCARAQELYVNEPAGVCTGDEGGVLVREEGHGNKIAIGVLIKRSPKCDERFYPAIYTRVSHYQEFIQNALAGRVTEAMRMYQGLR